MINIENHHKIALIDTGARRCCMNEEYYQSLGSPPLEPIDLEFRLWTASGSLMPGMGFLICKVQIGGESYKQQFIICKHLTPGIILGRDFLSRNQLGITLGQEGVFQLRDSPGTLAQVVEEENTSPAVLVAQTAIPPRSLILATLITTLPSYKNKTHFDFTPLQTMS